MPPGSKLVPVTFKNGEGKAITFVDEVLKVEKKTWFKEAVLTRASGRAMSKVRLVELMRRGLGDEDLEVIEERFHGFLWAMTMGDLLGRGCVYGPTRPGSIEAGRLRCSQEIAEGSLQGLFVRRDWRHDRDGTMFLELLAAKRLDLPKSPRPKFHIVVNEDDRFQITEVRWNGVHITADSVDATKRAVEGPGQPHGASFQRSAAEINRQRTIGGEDPDSKSSPRRRRSGSDSSWHESNDESPVSGVKHRRLTQQRMETNKRRRTIPAAVAGGGGFPDVEVIDLAADDDDDPEDLDDVGGGEDEQAPMAAQPRAPPQANEVRHGIRDEVRAANDPERVEQNRVAPAHLIHDVDDVVAAPSTMPDSIEFVLLLSPTLPSREITYAGQQIFEQGSLDGRAQARHPRFRPNWFQEFSGRVLRPLLCYHHASLPAGRDPLVFECEERNVFFYVSADGSGQDLRPISLLDLPTSSSSVHAQQRRTVYAYVQGISQWTASINIVANDGAAPGAATSPPRLPSPSTEPALEAGAAQSSYASSSRSSATDPETSSAGSTVAVATACSNERTCAEGAPVNEQALQADDATDSKPSASRPGGAASSYPELASRGRSESPREAAGMKKPPAPTHLMADSLHQENVTIGDGGAAAAGAGAFGLESTVRQGEDGAPNQGAATSRSGAAPEAALGSQGSAAPPSQEVPHADATPPEAAPSVHVTPGARCQPAQERDRVSARAVPITPSSLFLLDAASSSLIPDAAPSSFIPDETASMYPALTTSARADVSLSNSTTCGTTEEERLRHPKD